MTVRLYAMSAVAVVVFTVMGTSGMLFRSEHVHAQSKASDHESRVERGFEIAPVPLNLEGKDRELVGLGSYLVNGVVACNDCHGAGPKTQFLPGGNPFFGQPKKINPATYLG